MYYCRHDDGSITKYIMDDFNTEEEAKAFVAKNTENLVEGEWLEIIDNSW
jgi:hypothetical protein